MVSSTASERLVFSSYSWSTAVVSDWMSHENFWYWPASPDGSVQRITQVRAELS